MRIAVGSDDRTSLTDAVLEKRGLELDVLGALKQGVDQAWPKVALIVGQEVASDRCRQRVPFCYTGTSASIAANKVPGTRAALCVDDETARGARLWNDANILCMSLRHTSVEVARRILDAWSFITEIDASERENIEKASSLNHQKV